MTSVYPAQPQRPAIVLTVLSSLLLGSMLASMPAHAEDPAELWVEGKAAMAAGRWEEAHEIFRLFADNYTDHPRLPEVWLGLARTEPDGRKSRRWLERIVEKQPASDAAGDALLLLAEADLLAREPEKAVVRLRAIERESYPPSIRRRALLVRAEAKRVTGDPEGAILDYSTVLDSEPDDEEASRALLGLGSVAASRGDVREAELYVSESFSRFPRGELAATALWRWASALMEEGLTGRARDVLERLDKHYPETPESAAARDLLDRAAVVEETAPREAPSGDLAEDSMLVEGAEEDAGMTSPADTSAVVLVELEEVEYVVRLGSFSFWEDADELRRALEEESEYTLRVVPERSGEPPYHLESVGISNRRSAFDFARWLESVGGYLTQVMETGGERH